MAALAVVTLGQNTALAAGCLLPDPALGLTAEDTARLQGLDKSRDKGLADARTWTNSDEVDLVDGLFTEGLDPPNPATLAGDYRCRTIKLGGIGTLTIYSWFKCRITADGETFAIEKLTGSQNFTGTLFPTDDGMIYRGAGHYGDEGPRGYGDDPDRNQVGCLWSLPGNDERHLLLEEPQPIFESFHDLIEFEPAA